jgi:hypothetical protein
MQKTKLTKIFISSLIVFCSLLFICNTLIANDLNWIQNPTNNHYYAETEQMDWISAESLANSLGGHLVTINDEAEQIWLINTFIGDKEDPRWWIGLNDLNQEGLWVWSSGEAPVFEDWCNGEPNDCCTEIEGEENVALMNDHCGGWNDVHESGGHYAIIELIELNGDIEAFIDIEPDTVNLKSKGNYITCYIELQEEYNAEDIMIQTVKLKVNGEELNAELFPTEFNDYNGNNIIDLMVKFDRESFYLLVDVPIAEITVFGDLMVGASFIGTDTVLVIDKGIQHVSDDHGSIVY